MRRNVVQKVPKSNPQNKSYPLQIQRTITPERVEDAPRMTKVEAAMISFMFVYYKLSRYLSQSMLVVGKMDTTNYHRYLFK